MLLKRLVLTLLLGAFSVSALPNPEAEDFSLETRDDAEELAARDTKHSKCGFNSGAYYKDGRCQCKHDWQEYNRHNKKCEKKCGDNAYYKHGKCYCKHDWQEYNRHTKKCEKKCGDDAYYKHGQCYCKKRWEEYNKHTNKCESKCGDDAYYKDGECHCKNHKEKYNKWKKECYCPHGKRCGGH